ncbi:MAG: hypothetical protein ACK5ND_08915 [Bacteroides sp.]
MAKRRLQRIVITGQWTLPVAVFIGTLCWVITYFFLPQLNVETSTIIPSEARDFLLLLPNGLTRFISYLLHIAIIYLLLEFNSAFALIRMRASIQSVIYFTLITILPEFHVLSPQTVLSITYLISLYFLFKSYQKRAPNDLFYCFIFIGLGSLIFPPLILLSLFWIIGAYQLQSLNLKSICAAVLGFLLPYWFLLGHAFYHHNMALFYQPFQELAQFKPFFDFQTWQTADYLSAGFLLFLFLISAIHALVTSYQDKIKTRSYLNVLITFSFFLFLILLMQPEYKLELVSLLIINTSILTAHFFALTETKVSNGLFIFSLIYAMTLFAFNIWTLS